MDDGPTFAELISLREAQQAKIRASLRDQNEQLRQRLEANSVSPGRGDSEEGSRAGSTGSPHPQGCGSDGQTFVGSETLVKFFNDMQLLIEKNHDADLAAFNALQDKFEAKQQALEQRIQELEEQHIVDERTKELLREEHMSQHLTLCAEIESIRSVADSNMKRLDTRDEAVGSLQSSVHAINASYSTFEERIVHVESIPQIMREDIHQLEERFMQLSAAVTAERATITAERNEALERQNDEFKLIVQDARTTVKHLEDNAADTMEALTNAKKRINDQITEGIQQVGTNLEAQLRQRLDEQTDMITTANQRMTLEHTNMVAKIDEDTKKMEAHVESTLDKLKAQYSTAVEDQLTDVVKRFEDFEEKRKLEFPTADSDRVQLMLEELESAFTMLEGIARNSMTQSSKSAANPQLQQRMDELDAKYDDLKIQMETHQPKITFSVPVQATSSDIDALSPEEQQSKNVERHLQRELEQAAVEQSSLQARKDAVAALNRAGANRRSGSAASGYLSPSRTASVRSPSNFQPDTTRTASMVSGGASRSVSQIQQPQLMGAEPKSLTAVRIQREQKEAALEKIQSVLKDIQQKFHELTEKEQKGAKNTPDARKVAQLIAQQKEAVYQKERQLIDHRNVLWREVSQLRETEQQLLVPSS